jgi:cation:H+ antiporter
VVEGVHVLHQASLPVLLVLFALGSAGTWLAGVRLSITTDVLSQRLGIGEELGGQIFLAITTNLPEIAIVAAAAVAGNIGLANGNILGGIAIQTVVLVLLDAVAVHDRPLSFAGADLILVLQGSFVVGMLALALMGMPLRLPVVLRTTPIGIALVITWLVGLLVVNSARHGLPWTDKGVPKDLLSSRKDIDLKEERELEAEEKEPALKVWGVFALASLVTLAAGVVLEQSSEVLAERSGLGGLVFGATILAAVTALPEVSTGLAAIRIGDYNLAFSDIFGSNAFLPVLLPLVTLLSAKDPLPQAGGPSLYLSALGIFVTVIYVGGVVFRPRKQFLRLGPDSWSVLIAYVLGIIGLVFVR